MGLPPDSPKPEEEEKQQQPVAYQERHGYGLMELGERGSLFPSPWFGGCTGSFVSWRCPPPFISGEGLASFSGGWQPLTSPVSRIHNARVPRKSSAVLVPPVVVPWRLVWYTLLAQPRGRKASSSG